MKNLSIWLFALFSFLLLLPDAHAAQVNFTPRASVTEEYNDNINLDRNNKEDDFITTVSAGFTAEVAGQRRLLSLSYDPSYSFYKDNDDNDGFSHAATLNFLNELGKNTTFQLNNYFLYTKDPLADRGEEDEAGNIVVTGDDTRRERDTYWRNVASTRLTHRFGAQDEVFGAFTYSILENDDPTEEDSEQFRPSAGLTYYWNVRTGFELNGGYTRGLFDSDDSSDFDQLDGSVRLNHRFSRRLGLFGEYSHIYRSYDETGGTTTSGDVENDYMVYAPSAGVFYDFGDNLTASLGAGYFYQEIDDDEDESGPFVNADINKLWEKPRWSFLVRGASGLDSQDFTAESTGFERYAEVGIAPTYFFTRNFFSEGNLSYRYSDFINSDDDRKDHRYRASVGLGYEPLRWMTLRLRYEFNKRDSTDDVDEYEENRALFTVTLQPDQPWRLK